MIRKHARERQWPHPPVLVLSFGHSPTPDADEAGPTERAPHAQKILLADLRRPFLGGRGPPQRLATSRTSPIRRYRRPLLRRVRGRRRGDACDHEGEEALR